MINLLKEEKKNIIRNKESYSDALKYENKSLEKDIDKFILMTLYLKSKRKIKKVNYHY